MSVWVRTEDFDGGGHRIYTKPCEGCPTVITTRLSRAKTHGGYCRSCNLTVNHPSVKLKLENDRLKELLVEACSLLDDARDSINVVVDVFLDKPEIQKILKRS